MRIKGSFIRMQIWSSAAGTRVDAISRRQEDGQLAVASSEMDSDVWRGFVDFVGGPSSVEIPASGGVTSIEWCSPSAICVGCDNGDVAIVTEADSIVGRLDEHDGGVTSLAFGDRLASASNDCSAKLWDVVEMKSTNTFEHRSPVLSLASSDQILFAGDEASVVRWDARTNEAYQALFEVDFAASALAVSREDHFLYVGLENGDILVFDLRWNDLVNTIRSAHKGPVAALVSTSSRDNFVVSAGNDCALALIEKQHIVRRIDTSHTDYIRGLADWEDIDATQYIYTGSWDGSVQSVEILQS